MKSIAECIAFNELLNCSVGSLKPGMSVRLRNCLTRECVYTVRDLVAKTEDDIRYSKGMGETTWQELSELLATNGLRIGMRIDSITNEKHIADALFLAEKMFRNLADVCIFIREKLKEEVTL